MGGGEVIPDNVQLLKAGVELHGDLSLHPLWSLNSFSLGVGPADLWHVLDFQQHFGFYTAQTELLEKWKLISA